MNEQESTPTLGAPRSGRGALIGALLVLAVLPSGYFYFTGRQKMAASQKENQELVTRSEALADSLDGARTQLLLDAALASFRAVDYEGARSLTSEFFDRIDRRSRRPGAGSEETSTLMELLAIRDRAITELSRQTPEAGRILGELATLHLGLADPELKARTPLLTFRASPSDTLRPDTAAQQPGAGIRPDTAVPPPAARIRPDTAQAGRGG